MFYKGDGNSGTSGMKASLNGVPHLSILDGWWIEGFKGKNGWAFGREGGENRDVKDSESIYNILENEVIPLYYKVDDDGIPHEWVRFMKEAMKSTAPFFSARRMVKEYVNEDSAGIDKSEAHERNRTDAGRSTNRYLKRIKYGNRTPNRDAYGNATDPGQLNGWMFEVVLDYLTEEKNNEVYGQHYKLYNPDAEGRLFAEAWIDEQQKWNVRQDPFSTYRAGFEVRTYRLCRRVLMFHHFPGELGIDDCLVRSTELTYSQSPIAPFITVVTQSSYVHRPTQNQPNRYLKKSLPPLEFEYSRAAINEEVREVDSESIENLPVGLDGSNYQWVDLDGEGISGILTEQAGAWYYKRNTSANNIVKDNDKEHTKPRFADTEVVASRPNAALSAGAQLMDLAGDGQLDLVELEGPVSGFYERTDDQNWEPFKAFVSLPNIALKDPNLKFIDLTSDGHADIMITEDQVFTWYQSKAEEGFGPAERVCQALDEEKGPRLVFADGTQSIYLADLSSDGLTDLCRVRNGDPLRADSGQHRQAKAADRTCLHPLPQG